MDIKEYKKLIFAACPNKTGDMYFLEKGIAQTHERLKKKAKSKTPINCSNLGMFCMKGCPRPKKTEGPVFKDGKLAKDTILLKGKVLYEVMDTRNKSYVKYDRELAKLMFPIRRSPSGPVKGTKSSQPPMKKNLQSPSSKPRSLGKSKKPRKSGKVKNQFKKTEFVESSIPNPILLLAAYSKSKNKMDLAATSCQASAKNIFKTSLGASNGVDTKPADTTIQPPTIHTDSNLTKLPSPTPPSRKTGWKFFGTGLHGGTPPKLETPGDKTDHGKMAAEAAESSKEAPTNTARKEASIATGERTEARQDAKASHEFKGTLEHINVHH